MPCRAETRQLILLAAADPSGDLPLVWRAAGRLGMPASAAGAGGGSRAGRVRHPGPVPASAGPFGGLPVGVAVRPAAGACHAGGGDRPAADPDRRAWHRAQAAAGPDEDVAIELERSAGRAQARGGLAAAAAFLERAVLLTADPARHAERALAAAQASMQAGVFGKALELLATAEAGPLDELASARVDLLRGQITFASGLGSDAPRCCSRRPSGSSRSTPAWPARPTSAPGWRRLFAGRLAGAGDLLEVCRAARALPPPTEPRTGRPGA